MSSPAEVTQDGASLLDADPALGRLLGRRAGDLGHRMLLPVLALPAGGWSPPPAAELGEGALALVVLAGALLREPAGEPARLLGPGDILAPWSEPAARWTACTAVRAVVIGEAFLQAVVPWPQASAHMLRRAREDCGGAGLQMAGAGAASAEDRLAELMWRLALRWGTMDGDGLAVPLQLAPAMLAGLAALPEPEAAAGLLALERARVATRRRDGSWLLRAGHPRPDGGLAGVRDDMRERLAALLARARATGELSAELLQQAAAQVRRAQER